MRARARAPQTGTSFRGAATVTFVTFPRAGEGNRCGMSSESTSGMTPRALDIDGIVFDFLAGKRNPESCADERRSRPAAEKTGRSVPKNHDHDAIYLNFI